MRAALCIDAGVGQAQAFNRPSAYQMLADDLRCIFRLDPAVPDRIGVNDDSWAVFALVETAGLVDADDGREARCLNELLELREQIAFAIMGTRGAWRAFWANVLADKHMVLKECQAGISSRPMVRVLRRAVCHSLQRDSCDRMRELAQGSAIWSETMEATYGNR